VTTSVRWRPPAFEVDPWPTQARAPRRTELYPEIRRRGDSTSTILRHETPLCAGVAAPLAGATTAVSQLWWRTDLRLVTPNALQMSEMWAPAGAGGARLPGRILHVQHHRRRAHLGRGVSRPPGGHLAVPPVGRGALWRGGDDGDRPISLLSFSQTLFLAFDLIFRPPGPDDFK
jgi:hypothetical protein